jgi:DNA-binding GntR family transcriptional regulator
MVLALDIRACCRTEKSQRPILLPWSRDPPIVYSMQIALALPRRNLSDDLLNALRNLIVDGSLAAGERINEVHLSQRLGVSRTPLREALARLDREGTLLSVPRIGWFVKPLSLEEFAQLYAIRPLLDPEALRLSGLPSADRLKRLRKLNARIADSDDADQIIALDDEFHLMLIGNCPNHILLDLIRDNIRRTRRYEIALMRDRANVAVATGNHRDILSALAAGDLEGGCAALRNNLQTGFAPIAAWLAEREEKGGKR